MPERFIIVTTAQKNAIEALEFKDTRPTKAPHNVKRVIEAVPLKNRAGEWAIPVGVLTHDDFKTIKAQLQVRPQEDIEKTAMDIKEDPHIVEKDTPRGNNGPTLERER